LKTLQELGEAVATRRKLLGLKQGDVAAKAGVTPESLSRFERGRAAEFGSRKLLAVLAVLGAELEIVAQSQSGNLDELRRERSQPAGKSGGSPGASNESNR
jgi:HTH-type transcriptional regulator / antitoxin HipB